MWMCVCSESVCVDEECVCVKLRSVCYDACLYLSCRLFDTF